LCNYENLRSHRRSHIYSACLHIFSSKVTFASFHTPFKWHAHACASQFRSNRSVNVMTPKRCCVNVIFLLFLANRLITTETNMHVSPFEVGFRAIALHVMTYSTKQFSRGGGSYFIRFLSDPIQRFRIVEPINGRFLEFPI
jgi:hypothetical protein